MTQWTVLFALIAMPVVAMAQPELVRLMDFEAGDYVVEPDSLASITDVAGEVISGARSLKGDSTGGGAQWNEFFRSPDGLLKAKEAYAITFTFKILARGDDTGFYALVRSKSGKGPSNWQWTDLTDEFGTVSLHFYTAGVGDHALIVGIRGKGAIAIDDITISADPSMRVADTKLPELTRTRTSPGNTTYYADSVAGDDANAGTSEAAPWKSLDRINETTFAPGDTILLKSGGEWSGVLAPGGSGTRDAAIVMSRYGTGRKPRIAARDEDQTALLIQNQEYWEISDLEITNTGKAPGAKRMGVSVRAVDFGTAHHIHLKRLYVHDVNGSNVKGQGQSGISWYSGGETKSRFDDLLIEGCRLVRCDRNGITGSSGHWARKDWFPSLNVVIRGNVLEDIGGDGIVPIACDGALVERNIVRGGRMRAPDAAAGIWPWSCDNTVVQYNEVSRMRGTRDGQGFDSDWNCTNTLIQYNYSHDNDGGFVLICNAGDSGPDDNIGNIGTVVRYNVSQNDGERIIHIGGPCKDTLIHNNTFYTGPDLDMHAVLSTSWGGFSDDTRFERNIFHCEGKARFSFSESTGDVFSGNVFFGGLEDVPDDASAITDSPLLIAPGSAGDGMHSLDGYRLGPETPCPQAGAFVKEADGW